MPVPKQRHSRLRQRRGRTRFKIEPKTQVSRCPKCDAPVTPHRVCARCGYYKGRVISKSPRLGKEVKKTKKTEKTKPKK